MYTVDTANNQLRLIYSSVHIEYYEFSTFKSISSGFDTLRGNYYISINFIANDKNNSLRLYLADITNQPSWTDTAIGIQSATEQISAWANPTMKVVFPLSTKAPRIIRSSGTALTAITASVFSISFASTGTANATIVVGGTSVILKPGETISYDPRNENIMVSNTFSYDTSLAGSELLIIYVV
jgi:hypothetical protein